MTHQESNPYHSIPNDCLHLIFHCHIFHITTHATPHNTNNNCHHDASKADDDANEIDLGELSLEVTYSATTSPSPNDRNWRKSPLHLLGVRDFQDLVFLKKYAHCCSYGGILNLREFLSLCRDSEEKPYFQYLDLIDLDGSLEQENEALLTSLRSVQELRIRHDTMEMAPTPKFLDALFRNIRGVRKLRIEVKPLWPLRDENLQNLRGIERLELYDCDFTTLSGNAFENLRGIRVLRFVDCKFGPNTQLFQNLRGIHELEICGFHSIRLSVDDFKNLRGIKRLRISMDDFTMTEKHLQQIRGVEELVLDAECGFSHGARRSPLSDDSFRNLRGVKRLHFCYSDITYLVSNSAFFHLRGIQDLGISGFPIVTSESISHLLSQGLTRLQIHNCKNVWFHGNRLRLFRNLKHLTWDTITEYSQDMHIKYLRQGFLRHLEGVEELHLGNVVIVSDDAFRHLSQVKDLTLVRRESGDMKYIPLSEAAFSHLKRCRSLQFEMFPLQRVRSIWQLLHSYMPNLQELNLLYCEFSSDARKEDARHLTLLRGHSVIKLCKKETGEWVSER